MREIKFRAWDFEQKKMIYNVEQTYDDNCRGKGGCYGDCCFGEVLENVALEVMQYTGFKDDEGRDIYEGDILHVRERCHGFTVLRSEADNWSEYKGRILFKDGCFFCLSKFDMDLLGDLMHWNDVDEADIRIIGNRYENPELMEGI